MLTRFFSPPNRNMPLPTEHPRDLVCSFNNHRKILLPQLAEGNSGGVAGYIESRVHRTVPIENRCRHGAHTLFGLFVGDRPPQFPNLCEDRAELHLFDDRVICQLDENRRFSGKREVGQKFRIPNSELVPAPLL